MASTRITLSEEEKAELAEKRQKDRARQRALQRSRRASNPQQYYLSHRQRRRAEWRAATGLAERQVVVPSGGGDWSTPGAGRLSPSATTS